MTAIQMVRVTQLREHELQEKLSPWMCEARWRSWFDNVARDGILYPIYALPDGRVFNGKHRLRAARELGLAEIAVIYEDLTNEQVADRIIADKLEHDTLTLGQRVCIEINRAEAEGLFAEAERRKDEGRREGGRGRKKNLDAKMRSSLKTSAVIANRCGVSQRVVEQALEVKRKRPALYQRLFNGYDENGKEVKIGTVYAQMKRDEAIANGEPTQKPREDLRKKAEEAAEIAQQRADTAPPVDESESSLTPANIIRHKIKHEMPTFVRHLAFDYELLDQSDDETVSAYMGQVKLLVECGLRLLERYELREAERAIYAASLQLFEHSKSEESIKKVEMMEEEYEDEK